MSGSHWNKSANYDSKAWLTLFKPGLPSFLEWKVELKAWLTLIKFNLTYHAFENEKQDWKAG